jgi:hypothetical protein
MEKNDMSDKKHIVQHGWQPEKRGYQPQPSNKPQSGYQPTTSESKPVPQPPPKKP